MQKHLLNLSIVVYNRLPEDRIGIEELCKRIEDEVKDLRQTEPSEDDKS